MKGSDYGSLDGCLCGGVGVLGDNVVDRRRHGSGARWTPGGRCTNSRIGPTWDNSKLRHFYWEPRQDRFQWQVRQVSVVFKMSSVR